MGYDQEFSGKIILDIETAPLVDAEQYLEEPTPPANYKNPDTIAAWVTQAKAEALQKCGLDVDLCRIVAIGLVAKGDIGVIYRCETGEAEEAAALTQFWSYFKAYQFVGYNINGFDLPVLLRRSLYLGVKAPSIQIDKYRHPQIIDLMLTLSNNGALKFRGLEFYAKRMNLPLPVGSGSDVAGWVQAGQWAEVEAHLRGDLATTAALASRLGVW